MISPQEMISVVLFTCLYAAYAGFSLIIAEGRDCAGDDNVESVTFR